MYDQRDMTVVVNLPPIENGTVPQVQMRYFGPYSAAITFKGQPSWREYYFSNSPGDDVQWVLGEDVARFESMGVFEALEQTRIDPAADALRRAVEEATAPWKAIFEQLSADVASRQAAPAKPRAGGGRPGRPKNGTEGHEPYHLYHHCPDRWTMEELGRRFLPSFVTAPGTTMSKRLAKFRLNYPDLASESSCSFCVPIRQCCGPESRKKPER
jgi:hypothetical protein